MPRKLKLSINTQFPAMAMALLVLMGSSSLLSASTSATASSSSSSSSSYSSSSLGFLARSIRKIDSSAVHRTHCSKKLQIFCAADLQPEEDQKNDKEIFDVSSNCIQPVFRSILPSHIQVHFLSIHSFTRSSVAFFFAASSSVASSIWLSLIFVRPGCVILIFFLLVGSFFVSSFLFTF